MGSVINKFYKQTKRYNFLAPAIKGLQLLITILKTYASLRGVFLFQDYAPDCLAFFRPQIPDQPTITSAVVKTKYES